MVKDVRLHAEPDVRVMSRGGEGGAVIRRWREEYSRTGQPFRSPWCRHPAYPCRARPSIAPRFVASDTQRDFVRGVFIIGGSQCLAAVSSRICRDDTSCIYLKCLLEVNADERFILPDLIVNQNSPCSEKYISQGMKTLVLLVWTSTFFRSPQVSAVVKYDDDLRDCLNATACVNGFYFYDDGDGGLCHSCPVRLNALSPWPTPFSQHQANATSGRWAASASLEGTRRYNICLFRPGTFEFRPSPRKCSRVIAPRRAWAVTFQGTYNTATA